MKSAQPSPLKPKSPPPSVPTKRRKYAAGDGTPAQRKMMLVGIVFCLIAVFFLPKFGNDIQELPPPLPPADPNISTSPRVQPEKSVVQVPEASIQLPQNTGNAGEDVPPPLPPISELLSFPASSPEEVDKRIEAVGPYFVLGSADDKTKAYKALLDLDSELVKRLPKLITTCETASLAFYADAARELKAVAVAPAIIERLNSKDKKVVAQFELAKALESFDDSASREFLFDVVKKGQEPLWSVVYSVIGVHLTAPQVDYLLQRVKNGAPDCFLAARAIARYATDAEKMREILPKIREALSSAQQLPKRALVLALSKIDIAASGSELSTLAEDEDAEVRVIAYEGLVRSPAYYQTLVAALQNENETIRVKSVILRALGDAKDFDLIPQLSMLMRDEALTDAAHKALVSIVGKDLGWNELSWMNWYESRKAAGTLKREEISSSEKNNP